MRPISSMIAQPPILVSELIDASSATWREDVVRTSFVPFDAEAILRIPLCTRRIEDFWACGADRRGRFSVSSVYKMLIKTKIQRENWLENVQGQSDTSIEEQIWTKLWNITVPSKIKNFLWRLGQNLMPTSDVLHHRHMATSSVCAICSSEDNWKHVLFECMLARSV